MSEFKTLVVMYHYVRPRRPEWGGIFPLEPAEFESQLDALSEFGHIIHPDDIRSCDPPDAHSIVLTFDDGTADHHEVVYPILRRRGLSGLFGVMSGPTLCGEIPNVHLVHLLSSKLSDAQLWGLLERRFDQQQLGDARNATKLYHRDCALRARIKYALNFALPSDAVRTWLTECARQLDCDLQGLCRTWYLSSEQIRDMHAGGMVFAVHAHRHTALGPQPLAYVRAEIAPCAEWLAHIIGRPTAHYIAPFGGSSAHGADITRLIPHLQTAGFSCGYLTASGVQPQGAGDFFYRRIDAVDLPPRRSAGLDDLARPVTSGPS